MLPSMPAKRFFVLLVTTDAINSAMAVSRLQSVHAKLLFFPAILSRCWLSRSAKIVQLYNRRTVYPTAISACPRRWQRDQRLCRQEQSQWSCGFYSGHWRLFQAMVPPIGTSYLSFLRISKLSTRTSGVSNCMARWLISQPCASSFSTFAPLCHMCSTVRVGSIRVVRNRLELNPGTGSERAVAVSEETEVVPCGMVLGSIGYLCLPVEGVPYDDLNSVIKNEGCVKYPSLP